MSEAASDAKPPLSLDDVTRAVIDLASQPDLGAVVSRFLAIVRGWAGPTAVLAAAEDPQAEAGWRLLPALCVGSGPLGLQRLLAQLVQEAPEGRQRPVVVRPPEEVQGVRVRENWIVPWWHDGESGVLVLRGVARDCPPNLGDALVAVSSAVWPRLIGSPAARIEALARDLQSVAERLQDQVARQVERLQASRPPETAETGPPGRVAELEAQLESARQELRAAGAEKEQVLALAAAAGETATKAGTERDAARAEAERLTARVQGLASEQTAAAGRLEELRRAAEAASRKAQDAEGQRDQARAEVDRLQARVQALVSEMDSAAARTEELRRAAEAADQRARQEEKQRDEAAARPDQVELWRRKAELAELRAGAAEEALAAGQRELAAREAALREHAVSAPSIPQGSGDGVRAALGVLRRTPYVPQALRAALEPGAAAEPKGEEPAPWLSVALLDRDPSGPESLVSELEAAGLRVWVANHPEELSILARTTDALRVAICDVMTFRPDQNVAGLLRSWEKDRPGLQFYLTRDQAAPAEMERARRVPMSLLAGQLQRPIHGAGLVAALQILSSAGPKAPGPGQPQE